MTPSSPSSAAPPPPTTTTNPPNQNDHKHTPLAEPNLYQKIKIAAAQIRPVFLDKRATTERVCHWIREAGRAGVRVVGFPEAVIPGYPAWLGELPLSDPHSAELYQRLFRNAVTVPGPETALLSQACAEAGVYAVVGINEKRAHSAGTMWNTMLTFGPDGTLLSKHQKYVATVGERLVHAPGTTGLEASVHTDFGGISTLICGENSNPLAVYYLARQSPTVHVASWPSCFGGGWDLLPCTLAATGGLAYSVKCFVINAAAALPASGEDEGWDAWEQHARPDTLAGLAKERTTGKSTIVNPFGQVIAGPMGPEEGLLVAEVDLSEVVAAKFTHDFGGHYNRPELFAPLFAPYM